MAARFRPRIAGLAIFVLAGGMPSLAHAALVEMFRTNPRLLPYLLREVFHMPVPEALTNRQREILQMVAEGRTAREIGEVLALSHKTVEFHKASIMRVLGLRSTADLTRYALAQGIIDPS